MRLIHLFTMYVSNMITSFIFSMCYNPWVIRVSRTHLEGARKRATYARYARTASGSDRRAAAGIEVTLSEKLDRVDLEYQLSEGVLEITSKLEEIHDDLREVHGELEDVKFKLDYPPDRQD